MHAPQNIFRFFFQIFHLHLIFVPFFFHSFLGKALISSSYIFRISRSGFQHRDETTGSREDVKKEHEKNVEAGAKNEEHQGCCNRVKKGFLLGLPQNDVIFYDGV